MFFGWEVEWGGVDQLRNRRISCVEAAVGIGFCGGIRGEEVLFASMKGILKFWE